MINAARLGAALRGALIAIFVDIDEGNAVFTEEAGNFLLLVHPSPELSMPDVVVNQPLAILMYTGGRAERSSGFDPPETDIQASEVVHTGSGTATWELNDDGLNACDIIVEVTASGDPGDGAVVKVSIDGGDSWSDEADVEADGLVVISDLHTIAFSGSLVDGDTYAWTIDPQVNTRVKVQERFVDYDLIIVCRRAVELWGLEDGTAGYYDQLLLFLEESNGLFNIDGEMVEVSLVGSPVDEMPPQGTNKDLRHYQFRIPLQAHWTRRIIRTQDRVAGVDTSVTTN